GRNDAQRLRLLGAHPAGLPSQRPASAPGFGSAGPFRGRAAQSGPVRAGSRAASVLRAGPGFHHPRRAGPAGPNLPPFVRTSYCECSRSLASPAQPAARRPLARDPRSAAEKHSNPSLYLRTRPVEPRIWRSKKTLTGFWERRYLSPPKLEASRKGRFSRVLLTRFRAGSEGKPGGVG